MVKTIFLLAFPLTAVAADLAWVSEEVVNKARKAVVTVQVDESSAVSGFFVSEDGLIVTQAGALQGHQSATIFDSDKTKLPHAKLLVVDAEHDLAVFATGRKTPAHFPIREATPAPLQPCVVLHTWNGVIMATDAVLLARGRALDWTESRFQEFWTLGVNPGKTGFTGAPIITADGSVAGMCDFVGGVGPTNKRIFALPEMTLKKVVMQARNATKPVGYPKEGEILGHQFPECAEYRAGLKLLGLGDALGARGKFQAAMVLFPENVLVIGRLADACLLAGDVREGERLLREVIRIMPQKVSPYVQLGFILKEKGDREETLRHFQDLTVRFPESPKAWAGLAEQLVAAMRIAEAVVAARKWTELNPDSFVAWSDYSAILSAAGDFAGASRARDKSSEIE